MASTTHRQLYTCVFCLLLKRDLCALHVCAAHCFTTMWTLTVVEQTQLFKAVPWSFHLRTSLYLTWLQARCHPRGSRAALHPCGRGPQMYSTTSALHIVHFLKFSDIVKICDREIFYLSVLPDQMSVKMSCFFWHHFWDHFGSSWDRWDGDWAGMEVDSVMVKWPG